jgi:hypothetical protein
MAGSRCFVQFVPMSDIDEERLSSLGALRMLRLGERVVLVGGGGRIDDGGAAVTVAGGDKGGREIVAQECDVGGMGAVGDGERAACAGVVLAV